MTVISGFRKWLSAFHTPVQSSSLIVFRIGFGLLMFVSMVRFMWKGWINELYLKPTFFFTYTGFEWIAPWSEMGMYVHFIVLACLSLCIAVGYFYRLSVFLFFIGFTYIELLDQTNYLNHYYLISLLSFLLFFIPLHQTFSIDAKRDSSLAKSSMISLGHLWVIRLQIGLVYVFAGIAKLNTDWLIYAQPLNLWLTASTEVALLQWFFQYTWMHYLLSWAGAIFDLTIVFFLLWKKTRLWAYLAVLFFHGLTALLFQIGMFPWMMMFFATIFFAPNWAQGVLQRWNRIFQLPSNESMRETSKPSALLVYGFMIYFCLQLIIPLRHWLYDTNVLWSGEGMKFSWRVMLVEKAGFVEFIVKDTASQQEWIVASSQYLTDRQEKMMSITPEMIWQLAQHIAKDFQKKGFQEVEVYANSYVSLNGRPHQSMVNPHINLVKTSLWDSYTNWILPLEKKNPILVGKEW